VETGRAASGEPCWLIHRQMIGRAETCKARQAADLITSARAIVPHICTSDKESALLCTANSVQRAGKANTFNLLAGGDRSVLQFGAAARDIERCRWIAKQRQSHTMYMYERENEKKTRQLFENLVQQIQFV
jgi:hypothetical protein